MSDTMSPPVWPGERFLGHDGRLVPVPAVVPEAATPAAETVGDVLARKDPRFLVMWAMLAGVLLAALAVGAAALMVAG